MFFSRYQFRFSQGKAQKKRRSVPQGLKPAIRGDLCGTAEALPCYEPLFARDFFWKLQANCITSRHEKITSDECARTLISLTSATQWVPRPSRSLRRAGIPNARNQMGTASQLRPPLLAKYRKDGTAVVVVTPNRISKDWPFAGYLRARAEVNPANDPFWYLRNPSSREFARVPAWASQYF